ncbi:uncharacterized protein CCOS01_08562 [Colletotrichum costaricense]|uniref:Uncharacterized protein n=1 Tax=Colletotrichum costaricense TaxID=1209916 RepID=A0AAI9YWX4_9PEZI|nr:uncharacterized protein CCOS01_08562 [Colletotrichum costaricense]KAK1526144.1 hypothetical protein CCOS01_08562 [Colletotrichum costaricense]
MFRYRRSADVRVRRPCVAMPDSRAALLVRVSDQGLFLRCAPMALFPSSCRH